jgi:SAM-dependent methyltransferase
MATSFGTDAERYDRARPRYPDALIARLAAEAATALDVGCGTGIVARQLREAGVTVLGVDVDARMAEVARRDGLAVEVAPFETWDPAGRTFDAVVAGQTWHWIDPDAGAAKAAAALAPGGRFCVFWNAAQIPSELVPGFSAVARDALPAPFADLWEQPAAELYASGLGGVADALRRTGAFEEPEEWRFAWTRDYERDAWLDQLPTFGVHTRLTPEQLHPLLARYGAAIDAIGGAFTMSYTTLALTARRAGRGRPATRPR